MDYSTENPSLGYRCSKKSHAGFWNLCFNSTAIEDPKFRDFSATFHEPDSVIPVRVCHWNNRHSSVYRFFSLSIYWGTCTSPASCWPLCSVYVAQQAWDCVGSLAVCVGSLTSFLWPSCSVPHKITGPGSKMPPACIS